MEMTPNSTPASDTPAVPPTVSGTAGRQPGQTQGRGRGRGGGRGRGRGGGRGRGRGGGRGRGRGRGRAQVPGRGRSQSRGKGRGRGGGRGQGKRITPLRTSCSPAQLSVPVRPKRNQPKKTIIGPFSNFFDRGTVGPQLFVRENGIRSFLSMKDVLNCAQAGRDLHRLCRTYTVPDILRELGLAHMSREHRIALGTKVMGTVFKYCRKIKLRPRRIEAGNSGVMFWAKLYHPGEYEMVKALIEAYSGAIRLSPHFNETGQSEVCLEPPNCSAGTKKGATTKLLRASFGSTPHVFDVTHVLRKMIADNNGKLKLLPPRLATTAHGTINEYQPATLRYWYIRLFGDPCPHRSKLLTIIFRDGQAVKKLQLRENEEFCMEFEIHNAEIIEGRIRTLALS